MRNLLSSYTNLVEIGRGGMATVYRATSNATGHLVAVKVLDMHLMNDPTARARFAQEASFRLTHPNIIRVIEHDVDSRGSTPYIVMEYVAGEALEQRLQREGKQSIQALMPILRDMGHALDYAHSQGVIHRDVKPNNILIRANTGQALLADFGIAKTASFTAYTATMARVGSVMFMSPEQAAGDPQLSPASDIYSLGVTAYYALSGRHPFEGEDQIAVARRHMDELPVHVSDVEPSVPRPLGDVVMRTLSKQPKQRPGSAGEFVQQMEQALLAPTNNALPQSDPFNRPLLPSTALPNEMSSNATSSPGNKSNWRWALSVLALFIAVLLCGLLALLLWPNSNQSGTQGEGTATPQSGNTVQPTNNTPTGTLTSRPITATASMILTVVPNSTAINITTPLPTTTATPPPTVLVIVTGVSNIPTVEYASPEPTSTRVPRSPVVIPTATLPLLYPPTLAPPTNTPLPPTNTPPPTFTVTPSPTPFISPIATPPPTVIP